MKSRGLVLLMAIGVGVLLTAVLTGRGWTLGINACRALRLFG